MERLKIYWRKNRQLREIDNPENLQFYNVWSIGKLSSDQMILHDKKKNSFFLSPREGFQLFTRGLKMGGGVWFRGADTT